MGNSAKGSPTKEFFVEMLTRDIELNDAILDLLDNCLDGVVRSCASKDKLRTADFYASYCANITISPTEFSITDNCGGIPRDTAENYAFRMGGTAASFGQGGFLYGRSGPGACCGAAAKGGGHDRQLCRRLVPGRGEGHPGRRRRGCVDLL